MRELKNASVLVCGGTGFIGSHLTELLNGVADDVCAIGKNDCNFEKESTTQLVKWLSGYDYVFNLIGYNGGIQFNQDKKTDIFFKNTLMNLRLLDAAKQAGCKKIVGTVASCAYPIGFSELEPRDLMTGRPHPSVEGHAYAKRNVFLMSKYVSESSDTKCVCVCPTTAFGPGDSLDSQKSKVVGSLIVKFLKAKKNQEPFVQLLGDGSPKRHLIYVKDLAEHLVFCMQHYEKHDEVKHLAPKDGEYTILQLATVIKNLVGYAGEIQWGDSSQNGQARKYLMTRSTSLGFTPFMEAIKETVAWYETRV